MLFLLLPPDSERGGEVVTDSYPIVWLQKLDDEGKGIPRVVSLLVSVLEKLVRENEKFLENSQTEDVMTVFHGKSPTSLNIQQYVERIFEYAYCSQTCFVVVLIYLDRFLQRTKAHLTSLNAHRLIITCVVLAVKFVDNGYYNAYFAKVGGVSTEEMNSLELNLLYGLDFNLCFSVPTFCEYCVRLEREAKCSIKNSWPNIELAHMHFYNSNHSHSQ